jgi:hypothetical protein
MPFRNRRNLSRSRWVDQRRVAGAINNAKACHVNQFTEIQGIFCKFWNGGVANRCPPSGGLIEAKSWGTTALQRRCWLDIDMFKNKTVSIQGDNAGPPGSATKANPESNLLCLLLTSLRKPLTKTFGNTISVQAWGGL